MIGAALLIGCITILVGLSAGLSLYQDSRLQHLVALSNRMHTYIGNLPIIGMRMGLNIDLSFKLGVGLGTGLSVGLNYWLLLGLFQGIEQGQIEDHDRRKINQGIRNSLRTSMLMGIISVASISIICFLLNNMLGYILFNMLSYRNPSSWLNYELRSWLNYGLSNLLSIGLSALSGACLVFLLTGGVTVWRHYTIRFLLSRSRTFPKYAIPFLDDATARILLRRLGGGYTLIHRLLLDYFADLDAETSQTLEATKVQKEEL